MSIRTRLATIPADSRRYRFVHSALPSRMDNGKPKKACTFYCVMMPSSAVLWLLGMYYEVAFRLILIVGGWVIGLQPALLKDHASSPPQRLWDTEKTKFTYPYKYSPLRGKQTRVAPWQVLLPVTIGFVLWQHWQWRVLLWIGIIAAGIAATVMIAIAIGSTLRAVVAFLHRRGYDIDPMKLFYGLTAIGFLIAFLVSDGSGIGSWVSGHGHGLLYAAVALVVFGIISWAIYLQRPRIDQAWGRVCPPLKVVEDEPPRTSEITA